jgi:hypothetical protein
VAIREKNRRTNWFSLVETRFVVKRNSLTEFPSARQFSLRFLLTIRTLRSYPVKVENRSLYHSVCTLSAALTFFGAVVIQLNSQVSASYGCDNGPQDAAVVDEPTVEVNEEALARVSEDIRILASEEMAGRQPGTPGIQLAEDYLVAQYTEIGLKPLKNGTYLQPFEVGRRSRLDEENTKLVLHGPNDSKIELGLGQDWQAMTSRGNHSLEAELVFVGYGISADELNFDEYSNVDVADKIVVLIRSEPAGKEENSVFHRDTPSRHATFRTKAAAARRAGALGVIFVNDSQTAPTAELDDLVSRDNLGIMGLPFAQIKRSVFEQVLEQTPILTAAGAASKSVAEIEDLIDAKLESLSQPLEGWKAEFQAQFKLSGVKTNNVIGILEGEGPLAHETIVIGGHYDHLGDGAYGSRAGGRREIHYGADDNASGTAAVLELARRFSKREKKPERRMVFICFSAEEVGLLGAVHYVNNPEFPLEDTVMMFNFDMIGWLRDDALSVISWNSSPQFAPVLDKHGEPFGLNILKPRMSVGGSDHMPFDGRRIPNLFFHTGLHAVYHTPEDTFEAINCEGAVRVIDYTEKVIEEMMAMEKRPSYGPPPPFQLGVTLVNQTNNMTIEAIADNSPAQRAGLLVGDVILEVNEEPIASRRALTVAMRQHEGKTVKFKVRRDDAEVILHVELVTKTES